MIVPYEVHAIKKDEVLFKEGLACEYVFLIKSGEVVTLKENEGRIVTIALNKEADFLGISKEFSDMATESAIAYSYTEVIPLPKKDIKDVISKSPKWINILLHTLSDRFNESVHLISKHRLSADLTEYGKDYSDNDEARYRRALKEFQVES